MPNQDDGADNKSVEIRLDDHIPPVPKAVTVTRKKKRAQKPRPIFPLQRSVKGTLGHSTRQVLNEKALEMYSDDESVYLSDNIEEEMDADEPIEKSRAAAVAVVATTTAAAAAAAASSPSNVNQSPNDKKETQMNSQNCEAKSQILNAAATEEESENAEEKQKVEEEKMQTVLPAIPNSQTSTGNAQESLAGLASMSQSLGIESAPLAPLEVKSVPPSEPRSPLVDEGNEVAIDTGLTPGLASLGATEDIESNVVDDKGDAVDENVPSTASSTSPSGVGSDPPTRSPTNVPSARPSGEATSSPTVAARLVWVNNLSPFFGNNFPSTQLQRDVLNQVVQRDNWEPDDISDSRLWMERFVLYSFYEAGGGDGWNLNFGWRNPDLGACDWFGVTCDSSDRVISLLSQFNSLEGSLPSELGLLEELTQIGLRKYRMAVLMVFYHRQPHIACFVLDRIKSIIRQYSLCTR
ncbi:MAG: hypothetical protein SGBAC_006849 [Bacillariaceae sp.]